ncbi:Probable protein arginine N-methyltransferase 6.1 [Eumeta japonica]|uniref:Probable protein arginine N-methyltransferase 6.1 n=1 Tax=Eumeta variegata TaxID=151549 RepID=A0A4C1XMD0_EUMVA|nr:Probable protein arginine N-methyltransferase 6.1 [Eumeta japonica]
MDVGCGTGILSIFCAQVGAGKVYAIEASNMAKLAMKIVKENNYQNIIEVIHNKVEDVILSDDKKVDIIVSEWMGFYLLHEGMLDSVLTARDMFLKEDGVIFPETAAIFVAPCSVPSLYEQWENVHGVSMTTFAKLLRESKHSKPEITILQPQHLIGTEVTMCWIDLRWDKVSDLDSFSVQHVVGANKTGLYQGISIWFSCNFPHLDKDSNEAPVILDTSPFNLPTHWKQTVIILPKEQHVEEGEPIAFKVDMTRDEVSSRRYTLQVSLLDPHEVEHPLPCSCHLTKCILIKTFMQQHPEKEENMELTSEEINSDLDE